MTVDEITPAKNVMANAERYSKGEFVLIDTAIPSVGMVMNNNASGI